ncbi:transmembrane protein 154 isoform X2 [Centroberyx affinis]|uniref:transmembrane protein 154 isoform X2 n=1 Tax=Centroberyx affinis TaxID=166261 RepID=UPI003A5C01DC
MSACRPGNMRGSWEMTPLLLLLLLTSLAGTVLCQYEDEVEGEETKTDIELQESAATTDTPASDPTLPPDPSPSQMSPSTSVEEGSAEGNINFSTDYGVQASPEDSSAVSAEPTGPSDETLTPTIILIPVVLVVIIIAMVVGGIVVNRRWNQKMSNADRRKDSYLDGGSAEKVPMPMFEEDVPSVLELEMEELDQWMSKDGGAAVDSKHT